ncbi:MAG: pyridoxal phosphate-dependent aminotransferase [Pseudohongiellaceae bacterium]
MTSGISRRHFLFGSSAIVAAGAVQSIPGTPFSPSVNLMKSALGQGDLPMPAAPIRMSSNENPWGPSRAALQAINAAIHEANLYTFFLQDEMAGLISELEGIGSEHISVGAGSGEILKMGGLLASMHEGSIVVPDPTFEDLPRYAGNNGCEVIRVPVNGQMAIDLEAMAIAIRSDTKLVYICNPNNPIPTIVEKNALRDFVLEVSRDRMVFVDEAYHEFVDNPDYSSMMDLVREGHRNIIIARTASKIHGLAGLRVGFGFSHPDLAAEINRRMTGTLNIVGMRAALASYRDKEHAAFVLRTNKEALEITQGYFREAGIRHIDSNANFTFVETGHDIAEVQARFLEYNIRVGRPFPPFRNWMRLSMAKPDEMRYFVQTYKKLYG